MVLIMSKKRFTILQRKQLKEALLDAYDSLPRLRSMLWLELDYFLDRKISIEGKNLEEIVEDLIKEYRKQPNGIYKLVRGAIKGEPDNEKLKDFWENWNSEHQPKPLAPAIYNKEANKSRLKAAEPSEIIATLFEWAKVHAIIQQLFFSLGSFNSFWKNVKNNITEHNAYELEEIWHENCEPYAKEIRTVLTDLHCGEHRSLIELNTILAGENHVAICIGRLAETNDDSRTQLHNSFEELNGRLEESLTIAGLFIQDFADDLQRRSIELEI